MGTDDKQPFATSKRAKPSFDRVLQALRKADWSGQPGRGYVEFG